jgi:hypothetical protein
MWDDSFEHIGRDGRFDGYARKMLCKRDIRISVRFGTRGFEGVFRVETTILIVTTSSKSVLIVLSLAIHQLGRNHRDRPPSQSRDPDLPLMK